MIFAQVLRVEFLKLRRSKVLWIAAAAYTAMVAMGGFFMWMMKNPGMAESLGLLGQKANLAVGGQSADWPAFLGFIVEMSGLGGLILLSVVEAFIFGREYAEGTAKCMLTLPVPRWQFALAKTIVAAAWFAVLTVWAIALSLAVGSLVDLSGLSRGLFAQAALEIFEAALMSLCLASLVAWVAVEARGYLAPLGFAIASLVVAVSFGATEWGRWCPWSILLWFTGASGPGKELAGGSYLVLAATFFLGLGLTLRHESLADNCQ